VPARANHLPNHFERIALQRLRAAGQMTLRALEPTTRRTVLSMMEKSWIELGVEAGTYGILRLAMPPCAG
jgi:hypothetical protein